MKKALAGILSTAMIFTYGVIPNTLTSVQAQQPIMIPPQHCHHWQAVQGLRCMN